MMQIKLSSVKYFIYVFSFHICTAETNLFDWNDLVGHFLDGIFAIRVCCTYAPKF